MRKRGVRSRLRLWFSKKSNRQKVFFSIRFTLVTLLFIAIFWGISHLPFFAIKTITVSDQSDASQGLLDDILMYSETLLEERMYGLKGRTRYFFQRDKFEQTLREHFLQISSMNLEPDFLGSWKMLVTQRNTFGTFCTNEQCLLVDPTGFAFMETDMHIGNDLRIFDSIALGEYIFSSDKGAIRDFSAIPAVILFLERKDLPVSYVSLRSDTRVVHLHLENNIGIWFDSGEALYDTTRALHIVFQEIFSDPIAQTNIVSVDVRNPLSIIYERR